MKMKELFAAVLISVIALSVIVWFFSNQISELQTQNNSLQNQINDLQEQNSDLQDENDEQKQQLNLQQKWLDYEPQVRITDFNGGNWDGWWNPVGVTLALDFTIRIYNFWN